MAQHDHDIANQPGAAFRTDLNNLLDAIISNNSGATAPTTTEAYMWWMDTTAGLLKIRNAADSGWVTVGDLTLADLGHANVGAANTFTMLQTLNAGLKFAASGIQGAKSSISAHATTMDIWAGGDSVDITGGALTVTDVANAPQAGVWRKVVPLAAHVITDNANQEVMGNANYTCQVGDILWYYSKTTTTFKVLIFPIDGESVVASSGVPIGTVIDFAADTPPSGYINCDGAAVSRTVTYDALFAVIGTTWGVGDGSTTFNLPDFRRHVAMGKGGTSVNGPANTVGSSGGSEEHLLTEAEMPSHVHGGRNASAAQSQINFGNVTTTTGDTDSTGGDTEHNNVQPSAVVTKCIKF